MIGQTSPTHLPTVCHTNHICITSKFEVLARKKELQEG